jgi:hypothetical protein
MRSRRVVFALPVASMVLVLPQVASAKGLEPLRVVTPSGKVGWVREAAAKAWWRDYGSGTGRRGCSCNSADATARYANKLFTSGPLSRWGNGWVKPWLLVPRVGASMLYYPPTNGAPGVVFTPAVLGSHGRRWDDWDIASPRMQNILRLAVQQGTVTTYRGSSAFPTGWVIGGGLAAVLLGGLILGASRRQDLPQRLASRLKLLGFRLSPQGRTQPP